MGRPRGRPLGSTKKKPPELPEDKKLAQQCRMADAFYWIIQEGIKLEFGDYELEGHEFQVDWLQEDFPKQVFKKAAQLTVTTTNILKRLHRMIYGGYKQGVLYLFPTRDDVTDFSKGRFQPIITNNPQIARYVKDTDAANIKRIGNSMLYLRGARAAQKIEGVKATSSQLKSIPVDCIVFDEKDEMSPAMIQLALQRFSHSEIQEEISISTPSIPDYGVDRDYQASDQRVRMIKCEKCNEYTCLELEFPNCLIQANGKVIRVCRKCKNEIYPYKGIYSDGRQHDCQGVWVAQEPSRSKDLIGWWISQLNSKYVNPAHILNSFLNPPDGNLTEVMNSMLGMAHLSAENQLTRNDVYACCGKDVMTPNIRFTTGMGVDVASKILHVIIGYPIGKDRLKVLYMGRLPDFNAVHDKAKEYNVGCAVIDSEPETREVRDFQKSEPYRIFLCDYQERLKVSRKRDDKAGLLTVRRTEICDTTHNMVSTEGKLEIPRRNPEVEQFALEVCNLVKVLEEDEFTGDRTYKYRKLGADHYRHALNYFYLACQHGIVKNQNPILTREEIDYERELDYNPFEYLKK